MIIPLRRLVLGALLVSAVLVGLIAGAALSVARSGPVAAPLAADAVDSMAADAAAPLGGPATAGAAAPAAGSGSAADGIGAELDAVLAVDQTTPSAAPGTSARAGIGGPLRRLAAWRKLVHATLVIDLPKRGLTTVQLDHGTISAATATSLTIKEADGSSVTVALGSATRVRRHGAKAAIADLASGDEVFAISPGASGGVVAALVVVPRA